MDAIGVVHLIAGGLLLIAGVVSWLQSRRIDCELALLHDQAHLLIRWSAEDAHEIGIAKKRIDILDRERVRSVADTARGKAGGMPMIRWPQTEGRN